MNFSISSQETVSDSNPKLTKPKHPYIKLRYRGCTEDDTGIPCTLYLYCNKMKLHFYVRFSFKGQVSKFDLNLKDNKNAIIFSEALPDCYFTEILLFL